MLWGHSGGPGSEEKEFPTKDQHNLPASESATCEVDPQPPSRLWVTAAQPISKLQLHESRKHPVKPPWIPGPEKLR